MTYVDQKLDERYFDWLYSKVADPENRDPSRSYFQLCETLFKAPFEWFLEMDENRAIHGQDLRDEFLDDNDLSSSEQWRDQPSSIFELMIALADAAAFQTSTETEEWFWTMTDNLGLSRFTDDRYNLAVHRVVEGILKRLIHRDYEANGRGGFFPLGNPREDQREVGLWYQLAAYVIENFDF